MLGRLYLIIVHLTSNGYNSGIKIMGWNISWKIIKIYFEFIAIRMIAVSMKSIIHLQIMYIQLAFLFD